MPYATLDEAIALAKPGEAGRSAGRSSPPITAVARTVVLGTAAYPRPALVLDKAQRQGEHRAWVAACRNLVHGGPGRAGGGEEMGGARGVLHYMQRTAVQGSAECAHPITREWIRVPTSPPTACIRSASTFDELEIGDYADHRYAAPSRSTTSSSSLN
jgi:oxepin-CoA hydrolase/3-oxo-5,6-dehydrosuberyl-CoA semialdehyde dehydrogenase